MSFHPHNIPAGFMKDLTAFLAKSNTEFDLPQVLLDAAKEAGQKTKTCIINEDKAHVANNLFYKILRENNIESSEHLITEYNRAVRHFSQ